MNSLFDNTDKPHIDYPLSWQYKLILQNEELIEIIIEDVLEDKKYTLKPSKVSKKKKYISFNIAVIVNDEKERLSIFNGFKNHQYISFVF